MRGLFLLAVLFAFGARGQVYSWIDEQGEEHFTNDPSAVPKQAKVRRLETEEPRAQEKPAGSAVVKGERSARSAEPPGSSTREREILEQLNRRGWQANSAQAHDPAYGPAFLHLAETSDDPVVVTASLKAIGSVYTPNPGAGATFNGRKVERLLANDEVYRVALELLDHEDFHVRAEAARVAGDGVWGPRPRKDLVHALGVRHSLETDPGVLESVRFALWKCHCALPEMVEAAVAAAEDGNAKARLTGVSLMSSVGKNGRSFDGASRQRMHRAAEPLLRDELPVIRAAALRAWVATAHEPPQVVRARLISQLSASEPFMRHTAVTLLGDHASLEAVRPLLAALDDTSVARVAPEGELPGFETGTVAEAALRSLSEVSTRALSANRFRFSRRGAPLHGAALAAEVERARTWAKANARALKLSP